MPSSDYTAAADSFNKKPQWLIEIDLDRCDNEYTSAPCTASDAGDGSRCYFSFPTCQDPANFTKTTKTYRFCLNDVPWEDAANPAWPLLKEFVAVPQKLNASKLFAYPEKITMKMALDNMPPVPDSDKTTHNTSKLGEFWHNLFARNRNYSGRAVRIKRGFNRDGAGFVLSDFEQIGPEYLLRQVSFTLDGCTIEAESPLAKLNRRQLPFKVSDDNVIQDSGGINDSVTTVNITDGTELPDPSDYTLNTVYIKVNSEIMEVTNISSNALTVVRGAFGTSAAAHSQNDKIKHVACFGDSTGGAMNSMDALRYLLEWVDVASGDVDTDAFDDLKDLLWPDDDVLRIVEKQQSVAKLVQQIRDIRGVVVFLDAAGQWSAAVMGPNLTSSELNDDHFVLDSVEVFEDDEERNTRVMIWYDPTDDDAKEPNDFAKAIGVVNAGLEGANNFNDVREKTVFDHWLNPAHIAAKIRNLGRRIITRTAHGVRSLRFDLDIKDGLLNVGDMRNGVTKELTDVNGTNKAVPIFVTEKKEVDRGVNRYRAVDTNFSGPFLRIGPDSMEEDYDNATAEDKQYGYWGTDTYNRVGTQAEEGYKKF